MATLELHIITNCVMYAPSTLFIDATYKSFCETFEPLPPVVWCDPHPNTRAYDEYVHNLKCSGFKVINKTSSLADAYTRIIKSSAADYLFILEHDWVFFKDRIAHTLPEILEVMRRAGLYYFRFNKSVNHICGWDKMLISHELNGMKYCISNCWSGNPHILDRKLCIKKGVLDRIENRKAKTLEKKLTDERDIKGAIYGGVDYPPTVAHLDGRGDVPKPHWSRQQAARVQRKRVQQKSTKRAICVPYKQGDMWRIRAWEYVLKHYQETQFTVFVGRQTGKLFNRAAACNAAARAALAKYPFCRVLFFADADSYVDEEQAKIACNMADAENRLVIAYDKYLRCSKKSSQSLYNNFGVIEHGRFIDNHVSGAIAVPVTIWKKVGGFDERFSCWGGEDRAFYFACGVLSGHRDALRVPGCCYHLYHAPVADKYKKTQAYINNIELAMRYKRAAGISERTGILPVTNEDTPDVNAMLAILQEPGGSLGDVNG